jgi:hypothetical protein
MTAGLRRKPLPAAKTFLQIQRLRPPNAPGRGYEYFASADRVPFDEGAKGVSLVNAWWLAELSLLAYVREAAAVERELAKTPFAVETILDRGRDRAVKGFVLSSPSSVIAVFRGTDVKDPMDWMHDLDTRWVPFDGGGRVHAGFARALDVTGSWPRLERALDGTGRRLFLAGHSLGGAVAQLVAVRLLRRHPAADCQLYTFGAPRAGDRAFADRLPARHFRVVNHRDPIPKVPPFRGFAHGGEPLWLDTHGAPAPLPRGYDHGAAQKLTAFARSRSVRRDWFSSLVEGPWRPFADHMPILYALHLWNAVVDASSPRP